MKILKSACEKIWLFDVKWDENFVIAGFACFAPGCNSEAEVEIDKKRRILMTPAKAINSPLPFKMANARLSLLPIK